MYTKECCLQDRPTWLRAFLKRKSRLTRTQRPWACSSLRICDHQCEKWRQEFWRMPLPTYFLDSWVGEENCPSKGSFGQAAVSWKIPSHDPWGIPRGRSADCRHWRDKDSQKEPSLIIGMVKARGVSHDEVAVEWLVRKRSHLCREPTEFSLYKWAADKLPLSLTRRKRLNFKCEV